MRTLTYRSVKPAKPVVHKLIYTVSELNRLTRYALEMRFPEIWVEGEISNFSQPKSGHWYFSLKDKTAQIRCAMFHAANQSVPFPLQEGLRVVVRAKVTLYETRGDYQLIISSLEKTGFGELHHAFEQLKSKLFKEGLFDKKHKKSIPVFPQCVGIISSPTGAAVRDILNVLKRRYPRASVIVYPSLVQGTDAALQIVQAIEQANVHQQCDVLILARGGGSLEDLWPFNEEPVARSIFSSCIPIITGIGHEIDFTIADFVADLRAPTPSAAAELAVPDLQEILRRLDHYVAQWNSAIWAMFSKRDNQLRWLMKHLSRLHPMARLQNFMLDLDRLSASLAEIPRRVLLERKRQLTGLNKTLQALSPVATLKRGYAIVTTPQGQVVTSASHVQVGETIKAQLASGSLWAKIQKRRVDEEKESHLE